MQQKVTHEVFNKNIQQRPQVKSGLRMCRSADVATGNDVTKAAFT